MVDTQVFNDMYEKEVDLKYQLYNGLFLTLPLDAVEQTGLLLPLLSRPVIRVCNSGNLQSGLSGISSRPIALTLPRINRFNSCLRSFSMSKDRWY